MDELPERTSPVSCIVSRCGMRKYVREVSLARNEYSQLATGEEGHRQAQHRQGPPLSPPAGMAAAAARDPNSTWLMLQRLVAYVA
jgi:hypothetical protein